MSDSANKFAAWIRRNGLISLLAVAHLPYLYAYYTELWSKSHYQFFPFALAGFAWLAISRADGPAGRHRIIRYLLINLDVCLIAAAVLLQSPWFMAAGAILLAFAVCVTTRDRDFNISLGYLILLPLLTLRPPLNYDIRLIQWLQKATTVVASKLLHHFQYLHLREGNVLSMPGKRLLVEDACSGVQSLFTVLFLAAVILCINRRKPMHSLIILGSGAMFAGVMNVLRVTSIAVAWQDYQFDLSGGWQHDLIGYAALLVAAGLVYSGDAFLSFFTDPVPDLGASGLSAMFVNPFTRMWNRVFGVLPRLDSRQTT
ncbi:MAG: exosortase/archaeosortase family protein [Planctomycetaceae bacterium]